MSVSYSKEVSQFCLEGRFIDFVIKDGYKLKGLLLATSQGQCYVKLAKNLRAAFDLRLPPGTWLQIIGNKTYDIKKDRVILKAERVMAGRFEHHLPATPASHQTQKRSSEHRATILVCQKSDCMKRGAKAVCQALEAALSNRCLEDKVTIKGTGCMKNCKGGPHVVMPDKTRYGRVMPTEVPELMHRHFTDETTHYYVNNLTGITVTSGEELP